MAGEWSSLVREGGGFFASMPEAVLASANHRTSEYRHTHDFCAPAGAREGGLARRKFGRSSGTSTVAPPFFRAFRVSRRSVTISLAHALPHRPQYSRPNAEQSFDSLRDGPRAPRSSPNSRKATSATTNQTCAAVCLPHSFNSRRWPVRVLCCQCVNSRFAFSGDGKSRQFHCTVPAF